MTSRDDKHGREAALKVALLAVSAYARKLENAAEDACNLLADMQPDRGTYAAKILVKLDRALKARPKP